MVKILKSLRGGVKIRAKQSAFASSVIHKIGYNTYLFGYKIGYNMYLLGYKIGPNLKKETTYFAKDQK